jgi:hypothetical protein
MTSLEDFESSQLPEQRLSLSRQLGLLLQENDFLERQGLQKTERYKLTRQALTECFQDIGKVVYLIRQIGVNTSEIEQTLFHEPGVGQITQVENVSDDHIPNRSQYEKPEQASLVV